MRVRSFGEFKMMCSEKQFIYTVKSVFFLSNRMGAVSQGCISVNKNIIYCSQHITGVHRWPEEIG